MFKYATCITLIAVSHLNHGMCKIYITPRAEWLLAHQPKMLEQEFLMSVEDKDLMVQHASRKGYFDAIPELISKGARVHEYDEYILIRIIRTSSLTPIAHPTTFAQSDEFEAKKRALINFLLEHNALVNESTIEHALIYADEELATAILMHLCTQDRRAIALSALMHNNERVHGFMFRKGMCSLKRVRFVVQPLDLDMFTR